MNTELKVYRLYMANSLHIFKSSALVLTVHFEILYTAKARYKVKSL